MARKRFTAEQIIHKLREGDVLLGQGLRVPEACRRLGVSDKTYYRWRNEYGGLSIDQDDGLNSSSRKTHDLNE